MTARTDSQKVILRFLDGTLRKGYIKDFIVADDFAFIEDESSDTQKVRLKELKAVFYVQKFEGDKNHREKKSFSGARPSGRRVFLRFKDGEALTGCLEGDTPWKTGFFLESMKENGFFLIPVDEESNNIKIFVVTSAIRDVTMIGG
jgi:hypothetical protein